ncbi:hypothetical protein [Syntrophomonas curvata]
MQLVAIENFRMIDRNKAAGAGQFREGQTDASVELIFYLQSNYCVTVKVGRHDKTFFQEKLDDFVHENRVELKKMVAPMIPPAREAARKAWMEQYRE